MTDRPKRPRDTNELAKLIVDLAIGEADEAHEREKDQPAAERGKNRETLTFGV